MSRSATRSIATLLSLAAALAAAPGCRKPSAETAKATPGTKPEAGAKEAATAPYRYPAPASGHYEEVNVGAFDLVDGVAYPAADGSGTVVYLASKAIASPLLAASGCPMTEARSLAVLRDASFLEVTIDRKGRSSYFASGSPFGGKSREEEAGSHSWQLRPRQNGPARVAGTLAYSGHGKAEFDLPVYRVTAGELSEGDLVHGGVTAPGAVDPTPDRILAAYRALRAAALQKDLAGILAAQGFDAGRGEKIRGLDGIDADVATFADRFLEPGDVEEPQAWGGRGGVMAHGKNSRGEAFANYYEFVPCGDRMVLFSIGLNPQ